MIAAVSKGDLYHEYQIHSIRLFANGDHLDEVVEMFVGIFSFLYVWLNFRGLTNANFDYRSARRVRNHREIPSTTCQLVHRVPDAP